MAFRRCSEDGNTRPTRELADTTDTEHFPIRRVWLAGAYPPSRIQGHLARHKRERISHAPTSNSKKWAILDSNQ